MFLAATLVGCIGGDFVWDFEGPKTFSRVGTMLVVSGPMTSIIWDYLLCGMQQRDSFPNNGLTQRVQPPASDVCLRAIQQGSLSAY